MMTCRQFDNNYGRHGAYGTVLAKLSVEKMLARE
jgi:hypothetical protein